MTAPTGSAGTAGAGYRVPPVDHPYRPAPTDPGQRPYCATCLQPPHHDPNPSQRDGRHDR